MWYSAVVREVHKEESIGRVDLRYVKQAHEWAFYDVCENLSHKKPLA
jgi:hypothetical protein